MNAAILCVLIAVPLLLAPGAAADPVVVVAGHEVAPPPPPPSDPTSDGNTWLVQWALGIVA